VFTRPQKIAALATPAFVLGLLVAGSADARPPANDAERAERIEKRMQRIDKMVRKKLAPKLGADEATTNKLVEVFQQQAATRHAAHMKMRGEMEKLKQLVDGDAGDAALDTQLARLADLREAMPERGAVLDETARFLTPEQQAKLVLAGPKMMKRRHGRHGRHGPGGERGERGERGPRDFGDEL
jgi:Spy/CpxP family protein refolding chaperone